MSSSCPPASGIALELTRTILNVLATSVPGVAGVTFSITMVAVSFASSNKIPRLINHQVIDSDLFCPEKPSR